MTFAQRVENEKKWGKCCNSCLHFDQDFYVIPCLVCSDDGVYSEWESCRSLDEELRDKIPTNTHRIDQDCNGLI